MKILGGQGRRIVGGASHIYVEWKFVTFKKGTMYVVKAVEIFAETPTAFQIRA